MSKSPDEIFNEAMQKEAYERFDENPFVAFERCADWLKENPHLIPSVKGLIDAAYWVTMNSGMAGDGKVVDTNEAHKDNVVKLMEALKPFEEKT